MEPNLVKKQFTSKHLPDDAPLTHNLQILKTNLLIRVAGISDLNQGNNDFAPGWQCTVSAARTGLFSPETETKTNGLN